MSVRYVLLTKHNQESRAQMISDGTELELVRIADVLPSTNRCGELSWRTKCDSPLSAHVSVSIAQTNTSSETLFALLFGPVFGICASS